MERLDSLSMEMLRMGSHKVVDTLAHSQSSTNMSKSISGASLASSQATQRTKCSSGFSSLAGSVRGSTLSSTTNTPGARVSSIADPLDSEQQHEPPAGATTALPSPATARGGSKTVLGGVLPTMNGMLRRRARFSGWKTEAVYSELRSTALLAFAGGVACSKGTGGTGTSPSSGGSLANLAAKIMHPQHKQVGEWSWSVDLAGAERVLELPALSKRDTFAFAVEFPTSLKKKAVVLAADTAPARKGWMEAMDRARRSVHPQDFDPLAVIGEGHFGKVLLVRWKNGGGVSPPASASASSISSRKNSLSSTAPLPSRLTEEEGEDGDAGSTSGGSTSSAHARNRSSRSSSSSSSGRGRDRDNGDHFLAVKEVALHKGTSLPGVLNERQILGVLREHPFVVTLRCAWRKGNFLYYGLDFLPGADLFELFRRNSIKMDLSSARVYGGQVALALEHLHAHGICYRDLKPENILVDAKGHLRLADMGLSKILGTGENALRTSTVCGTRAYLAPEMVLRKPYGLSVDFWQFGCFVYELYAGHSPFWTPRAGPPGRSNDQTVALILAGEIHYTRSIGPIAKSFIRELLHPDVDSRLGCARPTAEPAASPRRPAIKEGEVSPAVASPTPSTQGAAGEVGGWQSVKQHPFFKDMDWEALLRGDLAAPIKPGSLGRGMVGNFSREYTRQRAGWGGDQQELRDVGDREGLFRRELMGFDFVRD